MNRKTRQRYLKRIYKNSLCHNIAICNDYNCIECAKSYVANFSGIPLTKPQILFLSKGLSFIPSTRAASHFELLKDFDRFCVKLRSFLKPKRTNTQIDNKFPLRRIKKMETKQIFFHQPT